MVPSGGDELAKADGIALVTASAAAVTAVVNMATALHAARKDSKSLHQLDATVASLAGKIDERFATAQSEMKQVLRIMSTMVDRILPPAPPR